MCSCTVCCHGFVPFYLPFMISLFAHCRGVSFILPYLRLCCINVLGWLENAHRVREGTTQRYAALLDFHELVMLATMHSYRTTVCFMVLN